MEERLIVFEAEEKDLKQMQFGDLIQFVASATVFLSMEPHLSKDLNEEEKEISVQRMIKADLLLSLAKDRLNQWS